MESTASIRLDLATPRVVWLRNGSPLDGSPELVSSRLFHKRKVMRLAHPYLNENQIAHLGDDAVSYLQVDLHFNFKLVSGELTSAPAGTPALRD
jgi:hypothetical protein